MDLYTRCRFFPNCSLHLGRSLPIAFSAENVREMVQMRREGLNLPTIAEEFNTIPQVVGRLTRRNRQYESEQGPPDRRGSEPAGKP